MYAGLGTIVRLTPQLGNFPEADAANLEVPVEKVDVIFLGIDGLRQDVFYPANENSVQQAEADYHVDPHELLGFGQILGGTQQGLSVVGDLERYHKRLPQVSSVFPSITLTSWASILTGRPPSETGILGNEFYTRDQVSTEVRRRSDGIVTLSEGAFPQNILDIKALVPPAGVVSTVAKPEDLPTVQNDPEILVGPNSQKIETIFETLRTGTDDYLVALRDRYGPGEVGPGGLISTEDDLSVMVWNHYSRGASKWVTMAYADIPMIAKVYLEHGESEFLDVIPQVNGGHYISATLGDDKPFPALSGFYYPGLDHEAHDAGHGTDGSLYRGYLKDHMDHSVLDLVYSLILHGEFHNKIFVLTADHGHTRVTDVPGDSVECGLDLGDMDESDDRNEEREGNTNLHIWELARILQQGNELLSELHPAGPVPFRPHLAISEEMNGLDELKNQGDKVDLSVFPGAAGANVVAMLNGPMAHLYVRPFASPWPTYPSETELGVVAELLRLTLMGGKQFRPDGTRAFAPTKNAAFGVMDREKQAKFLEKIDLARLTGQPDPSEHQGPQGAIDFILVRVGGEYYVFNGLEPDPLATPTPTTAPTDTPPPPPTEGGPGDTPEPGATGTSTPTATPTPTDTPTPTPTPQVTIKMRTISLETFFENMPGATQTGSGKQHYVDAVKRIQEMNRLDRSGDIVLVMRSRSDEPAAFRYTTGVSCRAWHASLNRSDSYVPLILSYPGGNRIVLDEVYSEVCGSGDASGPKDCSQNKVVPELIKAIFQKEYFP